MTSPISPMPSFDQTTANHQPAATWARRVWLVALALLLTVPSALEAAGPQFRKLDPELSRRAAAGGPGSSQVIVRLQPGTGLPVSLQRYGRGLRLRLVDGYVLTLPDRAISALEGLPQVVSAHHDRPTWAADYLSTRATGADLTQRVLGYTGAGVGVAVLDSGVTTWHDDLTNRSSRSYPYGNQRVSRFVDFVNGQTQPYDDHGHGSHVAGIILGNGYDSNGRHVGMAPDASLVSLKVLDGSGRGTISRIIEALDWIATNGRTYDIRVVNLSVGAAVTQSYWIDPLTLATRRLTEQGIVVVAAAGNLGQNAAGERQYGGILAPGNAPWVLTVGASSTSGTAWRRDDVLANFSSLGPTRGDYLAKPDIVAPGHGVLSLAVPGSTLYTSNASYLVPGQVSLGYPAYLSLSGTSMAAPQVAGTVALMLQANPRLTPNLVKAILQYTAQNRPEYNALQEGAGFLDTAGAVALSRFYAANRAGAALPVRPTWSRHIVWGNYELTGGYINPLANAWATNIVWGTAAGDAENIVWGTLCSTEACDNIVWGTADATGENIVWGTVAGDAENIVWGTALDDAENIVWGTAADEPENIVWGTACGGENCSNIVWGTVNEADNIVWGTVGENENIVWGTAAGEADNIVWGTADESGNIVWGTAAGDGDAANIVWGTAAGEADNIVWGTSGETANTVWVTPEETESDVNIWSAGE